MYAVVLIHDFSPLFYFISKFYLNVDLFIEVISYFSCLIYTKIGWILVWKWKWYKISGWANTGLFAYCNCHHYERKHSKIQQLRFHSKINANQTMPLWVFTVILQQVYVWMKNYPKKNYLISFFVQQVYVYFLEPAWVAIYHVNNVFLEPYQMTS